MDKNTFTTVLPEFGRAVGPHHAPLSHTDMLTCILLVTLYHWQQLTAPEFREDVRTVFNKPRWCLTVFPMAALHCSRLLVTSLPRLSICCSGETSHMHRWLQGIQAVFFLHSGACPMAVGPLIITELFRHTHFVCTCLHAVVIQMTLTCWEVTRFNLGFYWYAVLRFVIFSLD